MPVPRYRPTSAPSLFSAGFRPFFLASALWAALALPIWLIAFAGTGEIPTDMAPVLWHVHEMVFGYGAATVAGFLLTAIPNWTGRLPLQGTPLAVLLLLWLAGRVAVFLSAAVGPVAAAILDLAFPLAFLAVVAREIIAGRNWRNLPVTIALAFLFIGNLLVHLETLETIATGALGNRIGLATLLMLIALVGGRIIPSFTRNWLAKNAPGWPAPAAFDRLDEVALALAVLALACWAVLPDETVSAGVEILAGLALAARLIRWRGTAAWREPLLWVLHLGYAWLALGLLLLGVNGFTSLLPSTTALHALTVGAVGTMTLAVMTRATLGHTGRPLTAGRATTWIYLLVTLAALLRLLAPLAGGQYVIALTLAGTAWSGAFLLFVLTYFRPLTLPRVAAERARPI